MSKDTEAANQDDPFDLKKGVSGVFILVIVCSFLWALAKFGPSGATWLTEQVFGLNAATPPEVPMEAEVTKKEVTPSPQKPAPVMSQGNVPEVVTVIPTPEQKSPEPQKSQKESARDQIQEALGGPEMAVVRHIAISDDETSMVALVKFLEGEKKGKTLEIYFDKDNYSRYISTPDSPIEQEIKIWDN